LLHESERLVAGSVKVSLLKKVSADARQLFVPQ
jgi:hypothetical protein